MSEPISIVTAVKLLLEWAKSHDIGPLQTVTMAFGVVGLFVASKFVKSAKTVVGGVHNVYEQALTDQKRLAEDLREELERARSERRALLDELEAERREKEAALRHLSKLRTDKLRPKADSDS